MLTQGTPPIFISSIVFLRCSPKTSELFLRYLNFIVSLGNGRVVTYLATSPWVTNWTSFFVIGSWITTRWYPFLDKTSQTSKKVADFGKVCKELTPLKSKNLEQEENRVTHEAFHRLAFQDFLPGGNGSYVWIRETAFDFIIRQSSWIISKATWEYLGLLCVFLLWRRFFTKQKSNHIYCIHQANYLLLTHYWYTLDTVIV